MSSIIHTTRRSAERALSQQPINGFGVRVNDRIVFRYAREGWQVARIGSEMGTGVVCFSLAAVLTECFKGAPS